jgi:hypothetical protein
MYDDGLWTTIQGEYACIGGGPPIRDKYMFDLNDELFTRGYVIDYFFTAIDSADYNNVYMLAPDTGPYGGSLSNIDDAGMVGGGPGHGWRCCCRWYKLLCIKWSFGCCFFHRVSCLPTLCSDVLYVDAFDGQSTKDGLVQQYLWPTFAAAIPNDSIPDVFNINDPSPSPRTVWGAAPH